MQRYNWVIHTTKKEKDLVTKMLEVSDAENMARDFIISGRMGYLFQNQGDEDWERLHKPEKIHISSANLFSFLARISVGASFRFLRQHLTGLPGHIQAGYLPCSEGKYERLGKVVQRCPMPFPIRTYDMCTQFQRECACVSCPDLFGPDKDGVYGMPYISEVSNDMLKLTLITSLVVRTSGRIESLRGYLEYTKKGKEGDWKRMFDVTDCRNLPLYIACSSGKRDSSEAYDLKESMIGWLNDQYKTNLPCAVQKSPHSFGIFLEGVVANLDEFIVEYTRPNNGIAKAREEVVNSLCYILQLACKGTREKRSSLMFIAHQIIADMEELISEDNERGRSPFIGDFICPGYGGKEGYTAMEHDTVFGRECFGPGYKDWNDKHSPKYFLEMCQRLREHMENDMDKLMLAMLGVEKVTGGVRIILTGRFITNTEFEHIMCKAYMGSMRSRGTRKGGA